MNSKNSWHNDSQEQSSSEEQQTKINEVRKTIGGLQDRLAHYCTDASIARHLAARNWNIKKATKMLKDTLKWRHQYKPEEIQWDEIAKEAETGKIYRTNYFDKYGRSVLVMRPRCQNTKSTKGQIRYLVYSMENAILNLPQGQHQMVWLIDFAGFNLSHISLRVTKETSHILQDHYPETLGLAILFNPPKVFESFWMMAKPFLDQRTCAKVKFVYSDNENSMKIMKDLFNMDELESSFGGNNSAKFNINDYAERMREDDKKMADSWNLPNGWSTSIEPTKRAGEFLAASSMESVSDESEKEAAEELSHPLGQSEDQVNLEETKFETGVGEKAVRLAELEISHRQADRIQL